MCQHLPPCPPRQALEHRGALIVAEHWDQGWSLLCNGVIIFDDGGEFVPAPPGGTMNRPRPPARVFDPERAVDPSPGSSLKTTRA